MNRDIEEGYWRKKNGAKIRDVFRKDSKRRKRGSGEGAER